MPLKSIGISLSRHLASRVLESRTTQRAHLLVAVELASKGRDGNNRTLCALEVVLASKWVYLYRAVDSTGATIDFLLSAKRDAAAAESFLAKALDGENHPAPRVINTDEHAGYPPAIVRLKAEETLEKICRHRPVQYLNNVLEQDHRAIKRRVRASQHFRSFWGAWRTIAGYEAIHMIRKGQASWSSADAKIGLLHRFILGLFAATS
jgi:IS6 family transposase